LPTLTKYIRPNVRRDVDSGRILRPAANNKYEVSLRGKTIKAGSATGEGLIVGQRTIIANTNAGVPYLVGVARYENRSKKVVVIDG
jgi:hypothetical protein